MGYLETPRLKMVSGRWRDGFAPNLQNVLDAVQYVEVPRVEIRFVGAEKAGTGGVVFQMAADQGVIAEDDGGSGLIVLSQILHRTDDRGWFTVQNTQGGADVLLLRRNPSHQKRYAGNNEP
jgi:hypothetical protein